MCMLTALNYIYIQNKTDVYEALVLFTYFDFFVILKIVHFIVHILIYKFKKIINFLFYFCLYELLIIFCLNQFTLQLLIFKHNHQVQDNNEILKVDVYAEISSNQVVHFLQNIILNIVCSPDYSNCCVNSLIFKFNKF